MTATNTFSTRSSADHDVEARLKMEYTTRENHGQGDNKAPSMLGVKSTTCSKQLPSCIHSLYSCGGKLEAKSNILFRRVSYLGGGFWFLILLPIQISICRFEDKSPEENFWWGIYTAFLFKRRIVAARLFEKI